MNKQVRQFCASLIHSHSHKCDFVNVVHGIAVHLTKRKLVDFTFHYFVHAPKCFGMFMKLVVNTEGNINKGKHYNKCRVDEAFNLVCEITRAISLVNSTFSHVLIISYVKMTRTDHT